MMEWSFGRSITVNEAGGGCIRRSHIGSIEYPGRGGAAWL